MYIIALGTTTNIQTICKKSSSRNCRYSQLIFGDTKLNNISVDALLIQTDISLGLDIIYWKLYFFVDNLISVIIMF